MVTESINHLGALLQNNLAPLIFIFDFTLKSLCLVVLAMYYERAAAPFFSNTQKHSLWLTVLFLLGLLPLVALLDSLMLNSLTTLPNLTLVTVLLPSDLVAKSTESVIYLTKISGSLLGIYVLILAFHLVRLAASVEQIRRINTDAVFDAPPFATDLVAKLCLKLDISRNITLGVSDLCSSPMTYGTFRPKIVLPASQYYNDRVLLENVLLHELGHIKRLDHLSYLLCYLVTALNWFNPFIWIALKRSRLESEFACDNLVLKNFNGRAIFAGQLLSIARDGLCAQREELASRAMVSRSDLSLRIENILQSNAYLHEGKMHSSLLPTCMLLSLFLLTGTGKIFALENESEYASEELRLIYSETPEYPEFAFEKGITGSARFSFRVNALGRVEPQSIVLKSSGSNQLFAQTSLTALSSFVFAPRKVNGKRVPTSDVSYTFEFDIRI